MSEGKRKPQRWALEDSALADSAESRGPCEDLAFGPSEMGIPQRFLCRGHDLVRLTFSQGRFDCVKKNRLSGGVLIYSGLYNKAPEAGGL